MKLIKQLSLIVFAALAVHFFTAQTAGVGITYAGALTGCQAIASNTICFYGTTTAPAIAISQNSGAFVAVPMTPATAGVTSFNGRTGAVVSVEADYAGILKYSDLAAPPTTISGCGSALSTTIDLTGCTIK